MKRGRPAKRYVIYEKILEYFEKNPFPSNVEKIREFISKELNENVSWNTVRKYLEELVKLDKLRKIVLPHSKDKNKEGITLFERKK
jgi:hypothetical protein